MALVESMINVIDICSHMTPESLIDLLKKGVWSGQDNKADNVLKLFESSGFVNRSFVHLTNIYVKDKAKFLIVNEKNNYHL